MEGGGEGILYNTPYDHGSLIQRTKSMAMCPKKRTEQEKKRGNSKKNREQLNQLKGEKNSLKTKTRLGKKKNSRLTSRRKEKIGITIAYFERTEKEKTREREVKTLPTEKQINYQREKMKGSTRT